MRDPGAACEKRMRAGPGSASLVLGTRKWMWRVRADAVPLFRKRPVYEPAFRQKRRGGRT